MENISVFLKTTISILITLAIITSGMFLWSASQPVLQLANGQAAAQARELTEQQYSAYDNQLVSGSQIVTAYRRYATHEGLVLYVQFYKNGAYTNFGMRPDEVSSACRNFNYSSGQVTEGTSYNCYADEDDLTSSYSSYYISPQSRFRATLIKDANNTIQAIYFRSQ
ncbi:hypothetical protein [Paenibacillus sp. FSL H8-0537]|uniref:hypothetical protein n=1 Tax=Paenibacillus sp. FSL H8-0537 TaxID=2921399 RepID=UPI0031012C69